MKNDAILHEFMTTNSTTMFVFRFSEFDEKKRKGFFPQMNAFAIVRL